jgi:predicted CXXCH cytochrome family protein
MVRPEETLCASCHQRTIAARRDRGEALHTPFAGGTCAACHTPHASGKAGLRGGELCAGCHLGTRPTWTRGQSIHAPFVDGSCHACHDAHGSKERALLKAGSPLCLGCHGEVGRGMERPGAIVHDALRAGACVDCHLGHGATQPSLLVHDPATLCGECHESTGAEAIARHEGYAFAESDCTGCHVPHSGPREHLLRSDEHAPFASGDCRACHVGPVTPPEPAKVKAGGLELCAGCHDFNAITRQPGAHAPVAAGRCFDCHAPHAGTGKALLRATGSRLCRRCHDPRAIAGLPAHSSAASSRDGCSACHPAHAPRARPVKRR